MKENKEEPQLRSAEEILDKYVTWDFDMNELCDKIFVLKAMEEYASQFKKADQTEQREYILCAANWYNDGKEHVHQPRNITRGFVVCGRRHHNIINTLGSAFGWNSQHCEQGFLTNRDRFVDRKEAYKIAFKADQIKGPNKGQCENSIGLTSEDLY